MLRMLHSYEDFCEHYDGGVKIRIQLAHSHIHDAERQGWNLGFFKTRNFLKYCRENASNFELAYTKWGVDFWISDYSKVN